MHQISYEQKRQVVYDILKKYQRIMDTNGDYIGFGGQIETPPGYDKFTDDKFISISDEIMDRWINFYKDGVYGYIDLTYYAKKYKNLEIKLWKDDQYQGDKVCTISEALDIINDFFSKNFEKVYDTRFIYSLSSTKAATKLRPVTNLLNQKYVHKVDLKGLEITNADIIKFESVYENLHTFRTEECTFDKSCDLWRLKKLWGISDTRSIIPSLKIFDNIECQLSLDETTILDKKARIFNYNGKSIALHNMNADFNTFFTTTKANNLKKVEITGDDFQIKNTPLDYEPNGDTGTKQKKLFLNGLTFLSAFYNLEDIKIYAYVNDMRFLRRMKHLKNIEKIILDYSDDSGYQNMMIDMRKDFIEEVKNSERFDLIYYLSGQSKLYEERLKKFYRDILITEPASEEWLNKIKYFDDKRILEHIKSIKRLPHSLKMQLGKEEAQDLIERKTSDYLKMLNFEVVSNSRSEKNTLNNGNQINDEKADIAKKREIYDWLCKVNYDDAQNIIAQLRDLYTPESNENLGLVKAEDIKRRTSPSKYLNMLDFVTLIHKQDKEDSYGKKTRNTITTSIYSPYGFQYEVNGWEDRYGNINRVILDKDNRALSAVKLHAEYDYETVDIPTVKIVELIGSKNMKLSYFYKQYWRIRNQYNCEYKDLLGYGMDIESSYITYRAELKLSHSEAIKELTKEFDLSEKEIEEFNRYLALRDEHDNTVKNRAQIEESVRIERIYENLSTFTRLSKEELLDIKDKMPKIYSEYDKNYKKNIILDMIIYKITDQLPEWVKEKVDEIEYPEYILNYDDSGKDLRVTTEKGNEKAKRRIPESRRISSKVEIDDCLPF